MIQPFHHNNLLSEFVANPSNEAWAKDLVCLSAKKKERGDCPGGSVNELG